MSVGKHSGVKKLIALEDDEELTAGV